MIKWFVYFVLGVVFLFGMFFLNKTKKQTDKIADENSILLSLESILPIEAKGKVYLNKELKSTNLPMVSTVFSLTYSTPDDKMMIMENFVLKTNSILNKNKLDYSTISIAILDVKNYKQYRVVIGKQSLLKFLDQNLDFYSFLNYYCPKTNAKNLLEYCSVTKEE